MNALAEITEKHGWRLVHFSRKSLTKVHSVKQRLVEGLHSHGNKPFGLWFSVEGNDDGWQHWCEAESFGLDRLGCETEIEIAPDAHILHLKNPRDIDAFTRRYEIAPPWAQNKPLSYSRGGYIKWRDVAKEYDGIVIAPYIWARRLEGGANWYYGWDCASGCIWNAKAVATLRQKP